MSGTVTRRRLLRWAGWFAALNIAVFSLAGLRYLFIYRFPPDAAGYVYVPLAYLGQMSVLAALPLLIALVPLALLWPRRGPVMGTGVFIASAGLSLLVLDTQVFAEHRFHLNALTVSLFEWSTWLFVAVMLLIFLVFQALLAGIAWRSFALAPRGRHGASLATGLVLVWIGGAGLHIWGDAVAHTPVTQFTRFLPLYYPLTAKRDLARLGWVDQDAVQQRRHLETGLSQDAGQLEYPLRPLECKPPERPLNVAMLLIDALRPDSVHPQLTPAIADFRTRSIEFVNHYSGGNSSRMAFFSMFYGLPTTYWQSFYDLQRPPVLMEQLEAAGYALWPLSAAGFESPTLANRTVFAGLSDIPGDSHSGNGWVTSSFVQRLDQSETPFFALLYYDPPIHQPPAAAKATLPMEERFSDEAALRDHWRRYRLAMHAIDREVAAVLEALEARNLLESTVVMVTSDHGYEFDDNRLGYIGHASNFSDAQLHATLLLHWPGRQPERVHRRTSHHDLPVTLLEDLLGCRNDPVDYSIGRNLFGAPAWDWISAGSYSAHAIVRPERIVVMHPGGLVEVLDSRYRPLGAGALEPEQLREPLAAMSRYFR